MLCVSARFVALLRLRRPEQRQQLQWPVRLHLCDRGAIKAPDGGGNGACAASGAWEQAHQHHCLSVCPHGRWGLYCCRSQMRCGFFPSREISEVQFGAEMGRNFRF